MKGYKRKSGFIGVLMVLSFLLTLFPIRSKGVSDIFYNFDDNVLIDSSITEFDSTFNVKKSEYYTDHYNATYSFENDDIGLEPFDWISNNGVNCSTTIISNLDNHSKVLKISDNSLSTQAQITNSFTSVLNGIIEFWWCKDDVINSANLIFIAYEGVNRIVFVYLSIDDLYYYDGSGHIFKSDFLIANEFIHMKIILNDTTNTYNIYVNNILENENTPYEINSTTGIDLIQFTTNSANFNYNGYIDAIGYSWLRSNWNFENEKLTSEPIDWIVQSFGSGIGTVERFLDSNTFRIFDDDTSESVDVSSEFPQSIDQSIEYYIAVNDISLTEWYFMSMTESGSGRISLRIDNDDLDYNNGVGWFSIKDDFIIVNTWFKITMELDDSDNTFDILIDDSLEGNDLDYFSNSVVSVDGFTFASDGVQESITYLDNFFMNSSNFTSYNIGQNIIPFLNSTEFKEVDKYEFAIQNINTLIPINTRNVLGWIQTVAPNDDCVIIANPLDSYDRLYRLLGTGTFQTKGIRNDNFVSTDNFVSIDIKFEMIDMTGNNGYFLIAIDSSDDVFISSLIIYTNGTFGWIPSINGTVIPLRNDITTGKIYRIVLFINYDLDLVFIDFYIDGFIDDSYIITTIYNDKNGLKKILLSIHTSDDSANIQINIDNIGVYSNGISQSIEYGYTVYNIAQNWNTKTNNLLYLKGNGTFHIGIVEGSYIIEMSMTTFKTIRNYYNDLHIVNGYDSDTTINNATFVFTLQNHYFNISTFKIDGVLLKEGINEYNLEFEHSNVDVDESYFYVDISNKLQFRIISNDTNLEYIQARFNIIDVSSDDMSISFKSDINDNAYGFMRINFTDFSNLIQLPLVERTTRFILSQNSTIKDFIILITDRDDNSITGLTSGYVSGIALLDTLNIGVSIITLTLIDMMIPLILILVPTLAISSRFGKETIVPMFILMSLILFFTGLIPTWLFFIIAISNAILLFFKKDKEVN